MISRGLRGLFAPLNAERPCRRKQLADARRIRTNGELCRLRAGVFVSLRRYQNGMGADRLASSRIGDRIIARGHLLSRRVPDRHLGIFILSAVRISRCGQLDRTGGERNLRRRILIRDVHRSGRFVLRPVCILGDVAAVYRNRCPVCRNLKVVAPIVSRLIGSLRRIRHRTQIIVNAGIIALQLIDQIVQLAVQRIVIRRTALLETGKPAAVPLADTVAVQIVGVQHLVTRIEIGFTLDIRHNTADGRIVESRLAQELIYRRFVFTGAARRAHRDRLCHCRCLTVGSERRAGLHHDGARQQQCKNTFQSHACPSFSSELVLQIVIYLSPFCYHIQYTIRGSILQPFCYKKPTLRRRKIQNVSVTEESRVVRTMMLEVSSPSLSIFFAMM